MSEKAVVCSTFPPGRPAGNKLVHAERRLSFGLWSVEEDGAVGGEDLSGFRGGELASGPHEAHAIPSPQGQDGAEGHGASTAAASRAGRRPRRAPQLLDAAVGHGEDGLHAVARLCSQQA